MKYIFIIFFIIISNKLVAQDINETIAYINTLLKASTYMFKIPGEPPLYENLYDKITVGEHGKLECNRFLTEVKTLKTITVFHFYAYLKSLQIGEKKDYSDNFVTTLGCTGSQLCFGGISVDRSFVNFSISTASNRDKLHNAFSHLIDLAKQNKDYYEKDPFGN